MHKVFKEDKLAQLENLLHTPKNIIILSHFNPDGDALGSSLGLQRYLSQKGHTVQCIYPSSYPPYYQWLPNISDTLIYSKENEPQIQTAFGTAELIFCVDFNSGKRLQEMSPFFYGSHAPKVVIDHHENPADEFLITFCEPKYSSTCEMIYHFFRANQKADWIDKDTATCLYTGLITDTGGFQFSCTHPSSHLMAADLMGRGIVAQDIYNRCFNNFSMNRLQLFGYVTANNLKVFPEKKLAYQWIDAKTKQKFNIMEGDTEGLVNQPMKVDDIHISVLFKEDKGKVRISLRSKGNIDVNVVARNYFEGGGHANAAGATSHRSLKDTLEYFESIIPLAF